MLRRMDRVSGRIAGMITLRGGSFLSIVQLDETVLRFPCVVSYSAEIRDEDGADRLDITVRPSGSIVDIEELKQSIAAIETISPLVADGSLTVQVRTGETGFFTTGTAKRTIADKRYKNLSDSE